MVLTFIHWNYAWQAYQPTEAIKTGDMLSKRENVKELNLRELLVEPSTTVQQMLEQYKVTFNL